MTSGLSVRGLRRLRDVMASYVELGEVPGLVTLVSRRGEVCVDAIGTFERDGAGAAVERDTIFRISSMTKPIAAAAALTLVEECRLRLDDPVDEWLPELANRRVLRDPSGPLDDTVPARRPITLRDLLTFRLGFGAIFGSSPPIERAAREAGVATGPPRPDGPPEPDEWIRRLGSMPLVYQPGERWMYNTGSEILGVLLARVEQKPVADVLRERLLDPLGMPDTGFRVPAEHLQRLPASYMADHQTGALELYDPGGAKSGWASEPRFPSCAAGLVSTVDDVLTFATMLAGSGRHHGERILSRPTVAAMTTDQLLPQQKPRGDVFGDWWDSHGWGYGLAVATRAVSPWTSVGQYGWDGGLGTAWRTDPAEELIAVLMTQRGIFPLASGLWRDFWTCVYAALDD